MLGVIALAVWLVQSAGRSLPQPGRWWRMTFGVLIFAGLLLGCGLIAVTYKESPTVRPSGYPFPIAAAVFLDGRWQGGLIYRYMWLSVLADFAVGLLALITPFRLARWLVISRK